LYIYTGVQRNRDTATAEQLTTSAVASQIASAANQHLKPSMCTITDSQSASFLLAYKNVDFRPTTLFYVNFCCLLLSHKCLKNADLGGVWEEVSASFPKIFFKILSKNHAFWCKIFTFL